MQLTGAQKGYELQGLYSTQNGTGAWEYPHPVYSAGGGGVFSRALSLHRGNGAKGRDTTEHSAQRLWASGLVSTQRERGIK